LLKDINGDTIPQYYDSALGKFVAIDGAEAYHMIYWFQGQKYGRLF